MENITELLGWSTILNSGILLTSTIGLISIRSWASNFHAKMFEITPGDVSKEYFRYLANYKIAILIFNLIPYVALKIMGH